MATLNYVHDPMCSWCYAFAPTWRAIEAALPDTVDSRLLVGGLAPDSDEPMPPDMRDYIRQTWRRIESVVPGTEFNFDFWTECTPRRSTYPACRAVLAARHLDATLEGPMVAAIQRAYYREARNPSDLDTLTDLAEGLGLDRQRFEDWMASDACQAELESHLEQARALGVTGFPSLVLETPAGLYRVPHKFGEPQISLAAVTELANAPAG